MDNQPIRSSCAIRGISEAIRQVETFRYEEQFEAGGQLEADEGHMGSQGRVDAIGNEATRDK